MLIISPIKARTALEQPSNDQIREIHSCLDTSSIINIISFIHIIYNSKSQILSQENFLQVAPQAITLVSNVPHNTESYSSRSRIAFIRVAFDEEFLRTHSLFSFPKQPVTKPPGEGKQCLPSFAI